MTKKPKRNPRSKPAAARSPIKIQPYGESNIGQQRQANEDSYLDLKEVAKQDPNLYAQIAERATQMGPLWIVADGMGGHVGGQQASRMVVREIMFHYYHDPAPDPGQRLVNAIHRANAAVYGYAQEHPELQGMGSTVVTAVLQNGSLHVAWVGDSRAYLLRQGHLTPLTEDHSWVQQALKQGTITREEAAAHPNRSVILRSIGAKPQVEPDLNHFQTQPGDIYLLCSDGLTGVVSDEEIKHALQSGAGPQAAVNRLIAQANERGGPDNITAAVIGLSAFKGAARPKSNRLPLVIAALLIALLAVVVIVMALGGGEKARETITKNLPQIQPAAQTSDTVIGVQTETPTTEPSPTQAPTPIPPTPTLIIATSPITTPTPTAAASPTITPTLLVSPTLLSPKQDESIFTGRPTTFRWRW
ncbi:MAG: Stp1/IreP family PP2C-type Ser/Thr phosphatase, partial [Anaerolineae bacterium]|nr:Stp1/IreP family PP2C-type Ser/Thr phosphatase [Anaerolineae bacterium]